MDTVNIIVDVVARIVAYIGTGAALVLALSSWLGKVWANRILEQDKLKYKAELEKVKSKYDQELEEYKSKLEKDKTMRLRYSEYQFKLYHELWGSLMGLQLTANNLWDVADLENLLAFVKQLRITNKTVEKNRLLIEEKHYQQLIVIFRAFGKFRIGKTILLELRREEMIDNYQIIEQNIADTVSVNKKIRDDFNSLLEKLAGEFRKQISGS